MIFDENTFFDPPKLEVPIPKVITTIEIPTLSTMPLEGTILEDFGDDWVMDLLTIATNNGEQIDRSSSDDTTLISTPESESTSSSHIFPSLSTPRPTASPQPPSYTLSPDLPVSNLPIS